MIGRFEAVRIFSNDDEFIISNKQTKTHQQLSYDPLFSFFTTSNQ